MGSVDYQVTYQADEAMHASLLAGVPHHRVVHRRLRSTYFDTADLQLHRGGITLRERCTLSRAEKTGSTKTECKIPSSTGLLRLSGEEARSAIDEIVGDSALEPVAVQVKTRQLLLVEGKALAPKFVIALDDAEVRVGHSVQRRSEVEAQIFTALPWTKRVSPDRLARFEQFCESLESKFSLLPAGRSGYQAIDMEHLSV